MPARYSTVAILLHWLIAVMVLAMIPMGLWMSEAIKDPTQQAVAYKIFQLHKSIGFTILALTVLRLVWRLTHRAPGYPATMKPWERLAARTAPVAFYALMILLPLTGWLYVSTGRAVATDQALEVATVWFGVLPIPHLPVSEMAEGARRMLAFESMGAHEFMAWLTVALVVLHAGAALKHQFWNRDGVLAHMAPGLKHGAETPAPKDALWPSLVLGVGLVAVVAGAGALAAKPEPLTAAATQTASAGGAATDAPVTPGTARAWTVDRAGSSVGFSGTHSGAAFEGRFEDWDAQVWFDPADLAGSKAVVTIRTASARTGDATQESSLQSPEWFDPQTVPTARFVAESFRALGGDRYEATGTLRVKDRTQPVTLPFTFSETGGVARVEGELALDRTAFNLGMASDPGGQWVSKAIAVKIAVAARPA